MTAIPFKMYTTVFSKKPRFDQYIKIGSGYPKHEFCLSLALSDNFTEFITREISTKSNLDSFLHMHSYMYSVFINQGLHRLEKVLEIRGFF